MEEWNRRRFISLAAIAAGSGFAGWKISGSHGLLAQAPAGIPDEILNPVEVSGAEAQPVMGKLPGQKRMYVLPDNAGEYHRVGSQVMKRIARREDTGDVHELATFTGNTGAAMPRHAYLSSHAAVLVLRGEIELEVGGDRWTMMRGDFANLPPGTAHGWTIKSNGAQLALFSMNHRIGAAFTAMGERQDGAQVPANVPHEIPAAALARAAAAGDFQLAPAATPAAAAVRVTNKQLPVTPGAYVLADGGGERFGGNTFLARNANTGGQFLFIITEGGAGGGVGAHFHARHFENFFALDGETLGWAYGKAVPLHTGDYFQAPPRNLHGFRLNQDYNRFAAFLTPGIFESFFTRGGGRARGDAAGRGSGEGRGGGDGRGRGGFAGGAAEMFKALQMSGRGPDGYPLDVHPAKLPLPPQDPIWTKGVASNLSDRAALLAHAQAVCGVPISREITPELRRALALKPRPEDFI
jgi:quercetin dioxygenase-like cupin family protein